MADPKTPTPKAKQLFRETFAGYAVAAEYIEQEKIGWLQKLTPAESWAIFEKLLAFGRQLQGDPATLQVFEPQRVADHIFMRQVLEKVAKTQGLI